MKDNYNTNWSFGKYKMVSRYREAICKIYAGYMQAICWLYVNYMQEIARLGYGEVESSHKNSKTLFLTEKHQTIKPLFDMINPNRSLEVHKSVVKFVKP